MLTLVIIVLLIILFSLHSIKSHVKKRRFWKLMEAFYGEPSLPLIGNAHQFGSILEGNRCFAPNVFFENVLASNIFDVEIKWDFVRKDFLQKSYELSVRAGHSSYKYILGTIPFVGLCEPETIEVLLANSKEVDKMDDYWLFHDWLGTGLLTSSGAKWRTRRKIITPTFHFKILEQFIASFNSNSKIFVDILSKNTDQLTDIYPVVSLFTLDVICEAAMGVKVNAQMDTNSEYVQAVRSICLIIVSRFVSFWKKNELLFRFTKQYRKYANDLKILHKMTNGIVKTRKEILRDQIEKVKNGESLLEDQDKFIKNRKKVPFLDLLLLSKLPDGSMLSDEDVREEVDTFMFEGHDTTSSAIAFAMFELANNPEAQQKALEEVLCILGGDREKDLTYENLQDMKYMEMVIKETLRLYPSVPFFGRKLQNDMELLDGRTIPGGCFIVIDVYSLGRNPRCYEDCNKFVPERFSPDCTGKRNPFAFVSFSAGSRNCIGQKFAMLEIKTVLAKTILNYELMSAGEEYQPRLRQEVILKSANGVMIKYKRRNHIH